MPNLMQDKIFDTIFSMLGSSKNVFPRKWCHESNISVSDVFHGCDERLSVEPTGFYKQNAKFSTLRLTWRGTVFKHMDISVDVIPAFDVGLTKQFAFHAIIQDEQFALPLTVENDSVLFHVAFSQVENVIVSRLPANIRNGLILAKAVRRGFVFAKKPKQFQLVDDF